MTAGLVRLGAVAAAICLTAACEGKTGAPDMRDHPHVASMLDDQAPTIVDASGATYFGAIGRRVTLEHGVWTGDASCSVWHRGGSDRDLCVSSHNGEHRNLHAQDDP